MATAQDWNPVCGPGEEIRIVLIGKTGNGKSASGNTILNREAFRSSLSPSSVTSDCQKARGVANGCKVAVIDTPGIYDTKYKEGEVLRKLRECISLSAPGPHVFLIVVRLGRFTEEEQNTVELLNMVFGEKATPYSMVLFTHGDQLRGRSVEDYFSRCGKLSYLISKCSFRYHVFANTVSDEVQVSQLLVKIKSMVHDNGGMYYTNAMYEEAEKAIQQQILRILEASAEQKRREEEKLRQELEGEELTEKLQWLDDEYNRKSRERAERKNKFLHTGMVVTSAEVGLAIGAAATAAGGPVCMGVGAVVGGLLGAGFGLFAPTTVKALKNKCSVQ